MDIIKNCKNCKYYKELTDGELCLYRLKFCKSLKFPSNICSNFKYTKKLQLRILKKYFKNILCKILVLIVYIICICKVLFKDLVKFFKKCLIFLKRQNWYNLAPLFLTIITIILLLVIHLYNVPVVEENDSIESVPLYKNNLAIDTDSIQISELDYEAKMNASLVLFSKYDASFSRSSFRNNIIRFEIYFIDNKFSMDSLKAIYDYLVYIWGIYSNAIDVTVIDCNNQELCLAFYPEIRDNNY